MYVHHHQNGPRHNNRGGRPANTETQRPKWIERTCFAGDAEVLDMGGESA